MVLGNEKIKKIKVKGIPIDKNKLTKIKDRNIKK